MKKLIIVNILFITIMSWVGKYVIYYKASSSEDIVKLVMVVVGMMVCMIFYCAFLHGLVSRFYITKVMKPWSNKLILVVSNDYSDDYHKILRVMKPGTNTRIASSLITNKIISLEEIQQYHFEYRPYGESKWELTRVIDNAQYVFDIWRKPKVVHIPFLVDLLETHNNIFELQTYHKFCSPNQAINFIVESIKMCKCGTSISKKNLLLHLIYLKLMANNPYGEQRIRKTLEKYSRNQKKMQIVCASITKGKFNQIKFNNG